MKALNSYDIVTGVILGIIVFMAGILVFNVFIQVCRLTANLF